MKSTDSPASILMIVQSLPPLPSGGAEIQALRLAEALLAKGVKVAFITPGQGSTRGYSEINKVPVFRLHSILNSFLDLLFKIQTKLPKGETVIEFDDRNQKNNSITRKIGIGARLRYTFFFINAYFFLLKRKKEFNILHSHTIEWPAYVAARLSKLFKLRLIVKDSTMNGIFNILRYPAGDKKQKLIIQQADFVAMTRIIQQNFIAAGIKKSKIHNIPNGIRINDHHKKHYSESKRVLFVGNLYQQPAKGVDILLKAWKKVNIHLPEAILEIAGDGDLEAYNNFVNRENIRNVNFLGKLDNTHDSMLLCDAFVLPSRREGMPNVLMEAMLKGLPCVATDISGSQDLIQHGINGLLVPPASDEELASQLIYILTNREEAQKMGKNARQTIITTYNIETVAEKYMTLYNL